MSVSAKVEVQLDRIARLNPRYRAFVTVDADGARRRAAEIDAAEREGRWLGLLHGMTIAVKDNIDTQGMRTAAGSALFADRVPGADAVVVERLKRAGAIVIGKAALMELAFGVRSLDAVAGQVRNPWNADHIAGGSSGGSAAAVALDLCDAALGSDTGGSIRVPAGFCGITGLRPTHGFVPNRGSLPVSVTMDTIGPMTRRVEDAARILVTIAGHDPKDPLSNQGNPTNSLLAPGPGMTGMRVGIPRRFFFEDIGTDVEKSVLSVADCFAAAGAEIVEIEIPGAADAHRHATTIIYCDACALHQHDLSKRPELFSRPVFERMTKGLERTGVDYANALRFREAWRQTLRNIYATVDLTLVPTSPLPAPLIVDPGHLETATAEATRFTFGGGLAGIPGISLICGFSAAGLPIGALLEAGWGNEAALIGAATAWQAATDWHLRRASAA